MQSNGSTHCLSDDRRVTQIARHGLWGRVFAIWKVGGESDIQAEFHTKLSMRAGKENINVVLADSDRAQVCTQVEQAADAIRDKGKKSVSALKCDGIDVFPRLLANRDCACGSNPQSVRYGGSTGIQLLRELPIFSQTQYHLSSNNALLLWAFEIQDEVLCALVCTSW